MSEHIFHITTRDSWAQALAQGRHEESTRDRQLAEVGFIHCSFATQVDRVAGFVYADRTDLLLLEIDPARLDAEVRVENLEGGSELFPHVYGPLRLDAVVAVTPYPPVVTNPPSDPLAPS